MSESEVSLIFDKARRQIDEVDKQAYGAKVRIIKDTAKELEKIIPVGEIVNEMIHQLKGRVSQSLIYRELDKKYKKPTKPSNPYKKIPHVESAIVEDSDEGDEKKIAITTSDGVIMVNEKEFYKDRKQVLVDEGELTTLRAREKSLNDQLGTVLKKVHDAERELVSQQELVKSLMKGLDEKDSSKTFKQTSMTDFLPVFTDIVKTAHNEKCPANCQTWHKASTIDIKKLH